MPDLGARVDTFLDEWFALEPVHATSVGRHATDDRWPDRSPAGRTERLAFAERWLATFRGLDDAGLTRDERIDRDLLLFVLEDARYELADLRTDAWSPMSWVYLIGDGLFSLVAREFAPLAERLSAEEKTINDELIGVQGSPVDLGGYYYVDKAKTDAVMRPSKTFNEALASF